MRALIVYVSIHHKNTEKVAKAMADVLNADLSKPRKIKPAEVGKYDLVGFGSGGIYWWRHHWALLRLVDNLPRMEGKKAFIFSTAGMNTPWYTSTTSGGRGSRTPDSAGRIYVRHKIGEEDTQ